MSEHYDLVVIGGGSGGMACAKQAASLGARVILFDYVKPSTQGSTWGLGGTCVNVGCIPKKLCHYSALLGQSLHDAKELGWRINNSDDNAITHDWSRLVETVTNHVKSLNFGYRRGLIKSKVTYINAFAKFIDAHTIAYTLKGENATEKTVAGSHIVIAIGGRPYIPSTVPGALQYAITSDDIFSLKKPPGKTLCVGGGYISMECAGFLTELGYDVTVAARSILLREFDRQCADKLANSMVKDYGVTIYTHTNIKFIEKLASGKCRVFFQSPDNSGDGTQALLLSSPPPEFDDYDTVLYATGRQSDFTSINLTSDAVGVNVSSTTGKIPTVNEVTNISHIYAVGDVCEGKQELTPVAIHAGKLLAKRLFASSTLQMNYDLVATTVFTPLEYGSVGLSEEDAIQQYGEDDLEVYLFEFTTLEIAAVHRHVAMVKKNTKQTQGANDDGEEAEAESIGANCLSKLICVKSLAEKVIGFHFIGPNAGEITQGFALSLKLGATKQDFDELVGIHPTDAESFCALEVTKRSGQVYTAEGGCGGGVCG